VPDNLSDQRRSQSPATGIGAVPTMRILTPFCLAYVTSHWLRAVNAVMAPDLVSELGLSASELGLMSAAYFLAFSAFQIPLGLLLDRFGPRRVNAALVLCAAIGAYAFAQAHTLTNLTLARALIGFGSSAGLMASIKAATVWFAPHRLAAINGWVFFAGGLGALAATAPAQFLLNHTTWRHLFEAASGVALVAAGLLIWMAPPDAHDTKRESLQSMLRGLREVYRSRKFWRIAAVAMLTQATYMGIQSLWAGPWLIDVAGLGRQSAANYLLVMAIAITVGSIIFGKLGSHLARKGKLPVAPFVAGVLAFCGVQLALALGWRAEPLLAWTLFGFFGTAGTLAFAIVPHYFPAALAGRALTALNVLVLALAFTCQWGIGAIIHLWPPLDGHYHMLGYQAGFAACLSLELLALAWFFWDRRAR
jgi:MFS family permease